MMTTATFDHHCTLYQDNGSYLEATVPFVRASVKAGDAVLVAVPGSHLSLLRSALSDLGDRVAYADLAVDGRNPGRILPSVLLPFADRHPGRRVAIVGEPVWPGRTPAFLPACAQHEALINAAFEGRAATVMCPYDAAGLGEGALADARRTHPVLIDSGARVASVAYDDPLRTADAVNEPLPPPPPEAALLRYSSVPDLVRVRSLVRAAAVAVLPPVRADELVLAAHELAANTIKHAGGPGRITLWTEPGLLVCQVDDGGHIRDPLAGRVPPPPLEPSGRGLLLVNQICDLVRLRSGPAGTSIRMYMDIPPA